MPELRKYRVKISSPPSSLESREALTWIHLHRSQTRSHGINESRVLTLFVAIRKLEHLPSSDSLPSRRSISKRFTLSLFLLSLSCCFRRFLSFPLSLYLDRRRISQSSTIFHYGERIVSCHVSIDEIDEIELTFRQNLWSRRKRNSEHLSARVRDCLSLEGQRSCRHGGRRLCWSGFEVERIVGECDFFVLAFLRRIGYRSVFLRASAGGYENSISSRS